MKNLKRYRNVILWSVVLVILYILKRETGEIAIKGTLENVWEFIKLVPPVFVILGLMDVWVPKEKMMKYMGEDSRMKGILLAFIMGAFAAGPLYAAFPVGAMLIRKGASIKNVMIFTGTWAACKIPMILIEVSTLGVKFTIIRLTVEIVGIIFIAYTIEKVLTKDDKLNIYEKAKKL